MNEISEAITSLTLMSEALEKVANKEQNYNTNYGHYLDQMSAEMYKMTHELREISYMCGGW